MTLGFTLPRHLRSPWHQRTSLSAPHHPGLFCSQYLNNLIQCPCRSGWDKLHLLRRAVSKQTNPGEPNKPWGGLDGDHGVPPLRLLSLHHLLPPYAFSFISSLPWANSPFSRRLLSLPPLFIFPARPWSAAKGHECQLSGCGEGAGAHPSQRRGRRCHFQQGWAQTGNCRWRGGIFHRWRGGERGLGLC